MFEKIPLPVAKFRRFLAPLPPFGIENGKSRTPGRDAAFVF